MLIWRTTSLRRFQRPLAFRRSFIWAPLRPVHRTGEGLRSVKQVEEEKRREQAGEEENISPETHTIFGSKKRDYWFYSDRTAGKGYSHFANEIYTGRPFVWPPLQRYYQINCWLFIIATILFLLDYEMIFEFVDEKKKEYNARLKPEAATLDRGNAADTSDSSSATDSDPEASEPECVIEEALPKKKKKKVGFRERRIMEYENRIRAYSTPDKIFRYFATLKKNLEDGSTEVFMTPEDFVRSLTPGVMQPRNLGLDKFKLFNPEKISKKIAKDTIFNWLGRDGLINFGDYLFLMTLLATPPSEFKLAFHVYDINGDGELDKEEFERVQDLCLSQSNVGQKHRDHVTPGMSFKRTTNSALSQYFFGADGKGKLSAETFLKFQHDLHRDILRIEFERRDPESAPVGIISEVSFAELLLLHAGLPEKRQQRMMKRVRKKYKNAPNKKGVSFHEVNDFFSFLYYIDKVDLALHFHKLAGKPLTKEMLQKVGRKITEVELSDTVVDIVVALFDENGDGQLSQKEFVQVMKKRMKRGLEQPKDTGLFRLVDAMWECSKNQLRSFTRAGF